jgi:membrane-bound ClpP family serine protease
MKFLPDTLVGIAALLVLLLVFQYNRFYAIAAFLLIVIGRGLIFLQAPPPVPAPKQK